MTGYSRRRFLQGSLVLGELGLLPSGGVRLLEPQRARVSRIGILVAGTPAASVPALDALRGGLRDLGYVEGQNIVLEPRFTEGDFDRYPELAAELVQLNASIIVAADPGGVRAAQRVSQAMPIVMAGASEVPVELGLIASLGRPGGTVTGLTYGSPTLPAKRLQLLKDAVPNLARVGFLTDANIAPIETHPKVPGLAGAAQSLGLQLHLVSLRTPDEFAGIFAGMSLDQVGAFVMDASGLAFANQTQLSGLAIRHRLPSVWGSSIYKDAALMTYGANVLDVWRRTATHVTKILKGASPADLPVELPTAFDFTINLKIAQALGLSIPQSVLSQATEVIQ